MATHTFTRGETVAVALTNPSAIPVTSVTSKIKKTLNGTAPVGEPVISFTTTPKTELPNNAGAGWLLTLTPEQCLELEAGLYLFDARLVLTSGGVEITDMEQLVIKPGATETV